MTKHRREFADERFNTDPIPPDGDPLAVVQAIAFDLLNNATSYKQARKARRLLGAVAALRDQEKANVGTTNQST